MGACYRTFVSYLLEQCLRVPVSLKKKAQSTDYTASFSVWTKWNITKVGTTWWARSSSWVRRREEAEILKLTENMRQAQSIPGEVVILRTQERERWWKIAWRNERCGNSRVVSSGERAWRSVEENGTFPADIIVTVALSSYTSTFPAFPAIVLTQKF